MKKIGIIGGAAWPSTLEYYRLLCEGAVERHEAAGRSGLAPTPPMIIESLVMAETRALRGRVGDEASWRAYDDVIRDALTRLDNAGCDFAIIANNTMHSRLNSFRRGLNIEILSILDVMADAVVESGATRAVVLGTPVTMRSDDYGKVLDERQIAIYRGFSEGEIDRMQQVIDAEFHGQTATETGRRFLLKLCEAHVAEPDKTPVILACTELPLAFPEFSGVPEFQSDGFKFVNTTAVHVSATLKRSLFDRRS
ncbi:MAG: aspartate/glutamate racemase family protein [Pseudomonadota bacterium]